MFNVDLSKVKHHPTLTALVDVLCNKTQNTDRSFFNVEVAYFIGKAASAMRATVNTKDRGQIPVNIYAIALGTSGYGKGHSVKIMEDTIFGGFRKRFTTETFNTIAAEYLEREADDRAIRNQTDPSEELATLRTEFNSAGAYPWTFDSGTAPAVKQLRHKLLLGNVGSLNLQIDEIGLNLLGSIELITLYLELYDMGQVKQKLTKNTAENKRSEEVFGRTPTNMLMFGTPSELFDGAQTEGQFESFLETGYARRCLFGYGQLTRVESKETPAEVYAKLINPQNDKTVTYWFERFTHLADPDYAHKQIELEDKEAILLLSYKMHCERVAHLMPEHEGIRKAEMSHRYFKALKLAGAYAFVDDTDNITETQLLAAIKLVEESGADFQHHVLDREKPYERLAKVITDAGKPLTNPDLYESLPFFRAGGAARTELMNMATAWAYQNHRVIKKSFRDGVEFYTGEKLQETNLEELYMSLSSRLADDYDYSLVPFSELANLGKVGGYNWTNHGFVGGKRDKVNTIEGFNLLVLDIDNKDPDIEPVSLDMVRNLMADFKHVIYTTKSHQKDGVDRFRLIMPINYILKLDDEDYKEFMSSICDWLPFAVDTTANQRERKWLTNQGKVFVNEGTKLFDVLDFIPRTSRNETRQGKMEKLHNLNAIERWFVSQMSVGNRNNTMIKYAMALLDAGMDYTEVRDRTVHFNTQLQFPLDNREMEDTIFKTVAKKYNERQNSG